MVSDALDGYFARSRFSGWDGESYEDMGDLHVCVVEAEDEEGIPSLDMTEERRTRVEEAVDGWVLAHPERYLVLRRGGGRLYGDYIKVGCQADGQVNLRHLVGAYEL